jgi:BirA family biotin operon repressor/biotin-[acetyl-CoA-carboxylase] ligase
MRLDLNAVRAALPGRRIEWYDSIGSTMTEAERLAAAGCPSGTVIGADEQTAGQGRLGRGWYSEAERGLYFTVVLRLGLPARELPVLTLALGLAMSEAITETTALKPDLRWPNDVLLGERKCAGILTHLHDGAVLAGIGLNVNHSKFPPEIAALATSLRLASGHSHVREAILIVLLQQIDRYCACLQQQGKTAILDEFARRSSYVTGRRVTVEGPDSLQIGTTAGLDPSGFLILRKDDGQRSLILAGGVRPL